MPIFTEYSRARQTLKWRDARDVGANAGRQVYYTDGTRSEKPPMFGFRWYRLLYLPIILIAALAGFLVVASDSQRAAGPPRDLTPVDAGRAKSLLKLYGRMLLSERDRVTLAARLDDINAILAFGARSLPGVTAAARVDGDALTVTISRDLGPIWPGRYLNLTSGLRASSTGLRLADTRIGGIAVPRSVVRYGMERAADFALGAGAGTALTEAVRTVRIRRDLITLGLAPPADLADRVKARLAGGLGIADPLLVRRYYVDLTTRPAGPLPRDPSLAGHLTRLLKEAARRAPGGAGAVAENKALLLALAMVFVDPRVESLAGTVRTGDLYWRQTPYPPATLAGRTDLTKHFLVSAVIEMTAGRHVSFTAGEFKELLDTRPGQSGFSFVDLAADRAGTRFGRLATHGARGAERLQAVAARGLAESAFFPAIAGLPEWIGEDRFTRQYGSVNSAAYRKMVADIDRRIARLELYGRGATE